MSCTLLDAGGADDPQLPEETGGSQKRGRLVSGDAGPETSPHVLPGHARAEAIATIWRKRFLSLLWRRAPLLPCRTNGQSQAAPECPCQLQPLGWEQDVRNRTRTHAPRSHEARARVQA